MNTIKENNYRVVRYFDDNFDGFVGEKHLSKSDAEELANKYRKGSKYLTTFSVKEQVAILGIQKFNDGKAYIFNRIPEKAENGNVCITAESYESLMDCFVFCSYQMHEKKLENLEKEYYARGGIFYDTYQGYKEEVLNPEKDKRRNEFRVELIEKLLKHNFREVGKQKYYNEELGITVQQVDTNRVSLSHPHCKKHEDIENIGFFNRMFLGSMFSEYTDDYRQLTPNLFNIPCQKDNKGYTHLVFEVTI
ncbi:hypothetical protein Phi4:1_gp185 [Cellulophaga phage phi4:1]|uniref:Uncharacterized protein n=3 Tax=Lightbulbvirus Cba41 TaxID=1918524 RepID=A0A0S2MWU9_9CAUD|nr:hypothetical protein Phi4:1_gp185 [Cellulophaga phage phi4:1]AGO49598.1 hypothetical protein Phi4:1_gp185 [Cellulophaga phage phi4:1]ALO80194.1 hypothetical protein Phi4113_185 [Cellulophaga phage phi4:1_13]ALO80391.1 hypothetical protein Phi4118_185 [Cellulophaga phage phi4:1_18]